MISSHNQLPQLTSEEKARLFDITISQFEDTGICITKRQIQIKALGEQNAPNIDQNEE